MGKKLDALLGRNFKTSKFIPLVNLAFSRLALLKKQREVRCSQAHYDVIQLLQLGHHNRALLCVEQMIKEQNLLDVYVTIDGYLNLLIERVKLIERERECPDELKEATSGLLFAESRCGNFPELHEIRSVLTSHFGKEFTTRAVEIRNNCGINPIMIHKLSTRQPSLESRMKLLKEIALENNTVLQLNDTSAPTQEKSGTSEKDNKSEADTKVGDSSRILPEELAKDDIDRFSDSMKARRKYKDVADAAQAAFQSAAYAAAAARAAVELSRSDSHDADDLSSPNLRPNNLHDGHEMRKFEVESNLKEKIHIDIKADEEPSIYAAELKRSMSSSDSAEDISIENKVSMDEVNQSNVLEKDFVFDASDDEVRDEQNSIPRLNLEKRPNSVRHRVVRGY